MSILLTGVDGFLGKKIFSMLSKHHEIFGISHRKEGGNIFCLDLTDTEKLSEIMKKIKPSVVVHAAALVNVELCEKDRELAYLTNVTCTENIARLCKEYHAKIIYISTDYVFSGKKNPYNSSSKKDPVNYYGETKSIGEEKIKNILDDFVIVRPTILYGFNGFDDKNNFVLRVLQAIKENREITLDNRRVKYPLLIDDVAKAIEDFILKDSKGVFHLTGKNPLTKFEFGLLIARTFNLSEKNIKGDDLNEPYRPFQVAFDSSPLITSILNSQEGLILVKKQIEPLWKS